MGIEGGSDEMQEVNCKGEIRNQLGPRDKKEEKNDAAYNVMISLSSQGWIEPSASEDRLT